MNRHARTFLIPQLKPFWLKALQSLTFSVRVICVISVMDSASRLAWLSEQLISGRQSRVHINAEQNFVACHFVLTPHRDLSYVNSFALIMVMFLQESYPESISMVILPQIMEGEDHTIFQVRRTPLTVAFPELLSKNNLDKMD